MKVIICGGRNLAAAPSAHYDGRDRRPYQEWLDDVLTGMAITAIISGKATGGDMIGEIWADRHGYPVEEHPANWRGEFGKMAGFFRNQLMVAAADAAVILPGNNGTRDTWARSIDKGILVIPHPLMAARWPDGPHWTPRDFSAS